MNSNLFVAWLGFMIPLVYSAGPNNLMCAATGAQNGFRNTLPFIAGVNASLILVAMLIGFGMGKISQIAPIVSKIISIAGSLFLLYLAIKMIVASSKKSNHSSTSAPGFKEGFILNTLNPKGIIGLSIMFNQFISNESALPKQVIILSISTVLISATAHFTWTTLGTVLSSFIQSEKAIKIQGCVFGIMLAGVAIWMLFY